MTADNQHFPCERCGICCRNIGNATFAKDMVLPSGVCKHLNEETNLCRIYSARPTFCNVDAFYDKYLSGKITREEFYRQNKQACRKFQGRESSLDITELEGWALPAVKNLKNESDSEASAKLKALDKELTLDKMSAKDRKVFEDNGIEPFKRNTHSAASTLPPIMLKQMKDGEWRAFEESANNPAAFEDAALHLDNYIDLIPPAEKEDTYYEFFLDFSQGRKNIKSIPFAEKMLSHITSTRDAAKLVDIVDYFERQHDFAKAEPFNYTLYEIFLRGEGTQRDLNKATVYLKASIFGINTDEKRKELRELYAKKNADLDDKSRIRKAYELVIADKIQFAKNDYAVYLREQGEYTDAIHWFAADGKFAEAYEIVDLRVKEKIDSTIEEFEATHDADSKYLQALKLMRTKFDSLQDIFAFDKPEKTPRTYIGIALMYTIFGALYTFVRTARRSPFGLIVGLLICGAAFFGGRQLGHIGLGLLPLVLWTFISIYLDARRRSKFVSACELWLQLPEHPALKERAVVFKDSQKIIGQSTYAWAFAVPVIATIVFASVTFGAFEMPPDRRQEFIAQMKVEPSSEEEPRQAEPPQPTREDADKSSEDKPVAPKADDKPKPEKIPAADKEYKPQSEKVPVAVQEETAQPPKDAPKPVIVNPLLTQTDVGKVFGDYYRAISERRYTDAYSHLTAACKNRLGSVEDFAAGHKDTLGVEILDFQQTAASAEAMHAAYRVLTRDTVADGVKVQIFDGQATLVKVGDKWFIDNLSSHLVETTTTH